MGEELKLADKLLSKEYTAIYSAESERRAVMSLAYSMMSIAKDFHDLVEIIKKDVAEHDCL